MCLFQVTSYMSDDLLPVEEFYIIDAIVTAWQAIMGIQQLVE